MEILIYYVIMAISFSAMFTYRYGYTVVLNVVQLLDIMDMEYKDSTWSPRSFIIIAALFSTIAMPYVAFKVFSIKRRTLIKETTAEILEYHFGMTKI